jgi:nuclease-like protein
MRVETNDRLVQRNKRIAQYLFFFSFGVLILGLVVINQPLFSGSAATTSPQNSPLTVILPSLVLPIAFITTMVSVRMTNLWVRPPRPEEVIREGLKGVSSKSVLYNYYHFPARHVLISPQGIFAIITRFQDGKYKVVGDKWTTQSSAIRAVTSIFRMDGIGNPTADALRAAEHLKKALQPIAPDIEVQPLIVFVDPRATIVIEDPAVPVLRPDAKQDPSLKDYLFKKVERKGTMLTPEQIRAFEEATLPARVLSQVSAKKA